MIKGLILTTLFLATPSLTYAAGCNLKNIPFGDNAKKISKQFTIPQTILNVTGDTELNARGTSFCDSFPEGTQAKLVFVDGEFVQVEFTSVGTDTALYDAANGKISKSKKNPKKPNKKSAKKIGFQDMWDDGTSKIGGYTQSYNSDGKTVESLVISSRKHAKKMTQQSMDSEGATK